MMGMLRRKLVRDLTGSKGLLAAITSIIAVGITCFVSMQSAYQNLSEAKQSYYRQCRMADFWIDLKKAPRTELEQLARMPGVAEIHTRTQFHATVDLPSVPRPINALVLSLPEHRRPVLNDIVIRDGDYFSSYRENEIIVTEAFATAHELHPGDRIHLLLNQRREAFLIVGTGISSEFTYQLGPGALIPDPQNFGVFYIKQRYAEEIFDFEDAANQVVGRLTNRTPGEERQILERLERRLESFGVFSVTPLSQQASNQFLSSEIEGLGAFATVVPAIFLVVAALVLNVLISRLARQQRTTVGTLKALGYSDGSLFRHFLSFGFVVGLAGGIAGSLLGYLAATGMTLVYQEFFEFPDLQSGFHTFTHVTGISVSLVCAVLGCLHGARDMLQLQAAAAMRPEPPRVTHAIWWERHFQQLWNRLHSGWRMALRGLHRARLRTAVGLFAAAMGSALLVTGFMLLESQIFLLDFQFERVERSDIDLVFDEELGREALDEVRALPGVDRAEPVLQLGCTLVNGPYRRKAGVLGLLADARLTQPHDSRGHPVALPDSGLVLGQRLADILHVQAGDRLNLIPVRGERRTIQLTVAAVSDSFLGLSAYADLTYLSRLLDEPFVMTGAQLQTHQRPEALATLNRRLKEIPGIRSVVSRKDLVANLTETLLKNQWVFIGALILFAGVVFFGSIVNASMVSLAERQREVATFLALGYDPWQIGGLFLRESMLVNLCGTALGLPIGYLLTVVTARSYDSDLIRLPVVSASWIWITTLLLAVFFALLAHATVQSRIHTMNYLDALKVKE